MEQATHAPISLNRWLIARGRGYAVIHGAH